MKKQATVVGADGFIGAHLLAHLKRQGWECWASPRHAPNFTRRELGTVFYCAGLTGDFAQHPHATVAAHVSLLNELLEHGRFDRLVYLSSTRLYDTLPGYPADEDSHLTLNPALPRHVYDLSKALGEALCRHASAGRALVARLSCVYAGVDDSPGFLGDLLRQVQAQREALTIDCCRHAVRDYVQISDVVTALVHIATQGTQAAYNVASGVNLSNATLFERLGELCGASLAATRTQRLPSPAPVSIARMQREFNWQPAQLLDKLPELLRLEQPCRA